MLREYKARGGTDVQQGFILEGRETVYRKWCKRSIIVSYQKDKSTIPTISTILLVANEAS
jgi:hypothetical protein